MVCGEESWANLPKVADNVTCGEVLADIVGCSVGEDAVASLDGTSNLSGLLPDNLGEMRRLRVARIVVRCRRYQHLKISTRG